MFELLRMSGSVKLHIGDSWGKPKLWGSVIWNFSIWCIFMKWQPFFNVFKIANADIPFLLTLRKPETETLGDGVGWSVIWIFSIWHIFMKYLPFFNFFIMADVYILFPKCKISVGSVFPSLHHFILGSVSTFKHDDVSMLKIFMCWYSPCPRLSAKHSWVVTFPHFPHLNIHEMASLHFLGSVPTIHEQWPFCT